MWVIALYLFPFKFGLHGVFTEYTEDPFIPTIYGVVLMEISPPNQYLPNAVSSIDSRAPEALDSSAFG
jgi:hypothetical protein